MRAVSIMEQTAFIGAPVFKPPTISDIPTSSPSKSYPTPQLLSYPYSNFNYNMNSCSPIINSPYIPNVDQKIKEQPNPFNINMNTQNPWNPNSNFALNQQTNQISPLISPSQSQNIFSTSNVSKKQKPRHFTMKVKFTPEEDALLLTLVKEHGSKDWIKISHLMNGKRNPRQCRERYKNYINPELRKDNWTKEEDELLIQKYNEYGGKWNKIAKYFVNRSDNHLRNRWMMIARHQAKGDTGFIERSFSAHNKSVEEQSFSKKSVQSSPNEIEDVVIEQSNSSVLNSQQQSNLNEKKHLKAESPEVEELSTANFWLNESAFNLLEIPNNGFELFGNDQSELWPHF